MRKVLTTLLLLSLCSCAHSAKVAFTNEPGRLARREHVAHVRCRAFTTASHFRFADKYLPPFKAAAELRLSATFEVLWWDQGLLEVDLLSLKNAAIERSDGGSILRTNNTYWVGFDEARNGLLRGTVTISDVHK